MFVMKLLNIIEWVALLITFYCGSDFLFVNSLTI